jgi:hypothetical protein
MRKSLSALLIVAAVSTSGCAVLGGRRSTPDEFAVARNAPLIIPPDFSLSPPVAGTAATATEVQQQAIDAIFGGPAPRSQADMSLLEPANRDMAALGIRSTVWDPDTRVVDKGPLTLTILAAPEADTNIATAQIGG